MSRLNLAQNLMPQSLQPPPLAQSQQTLRQHPPDYPLADYSTCPKTGLLIPKTLQKNLEWRQAIRDTAEHDEHVQDQFRAACAASILFWINAFVWTFRQKIVNENGQEIPVQEGSTHWPLITWVVQDEFVQMLQECIEEGEDAACEKSRDMGATWLGLVTIHWYWQFRANTTFLELSRKQQLVDMRGNMDCLFEKHRYINRFQPKWLRPKRIRDNVCHLENLDNGSSIEGESTNEHAGQGGRKTAIFLDEFARVQNAEEIDLATADTSACRIYNSTPAGPSTAFHKIVKEKRARILRMPWWRHPEKGAGAHQIFDPGNGRIKWTSAWYENECARRSKKDVASNLDMDHGQAGDIFFDYNEVERHRADHQRNPFMSGNLKLRKELTESERLRVYRELNSEAFVFIDGGRYALHLWTTLSDDRPSQSYTYVISADISNGSGGSNSVATILAVETGQIVAKFWDAFISPEAFADMCMDLGVWFGGIGGPAFLIWENNGPGSIFGRKVVKSSYPHYYLQKIDNVVRDKKTPRWGWHSNNERKEVLLGVYREHLAKDKIINPCKEGLDECLDYIYNESGLLIPGKFKSEQHGGIALHGDHVIADALAVLGAAQLPRHREQQGPVPAGSFQYRRNLKLKAKREEDPWGR